MISQKRHGQGMGQHTKEQWVQAASASTGRISVLWSELAEKRKEPMRDYRVNHVRLQEVLAPEASILRRSWAGG
jgi:hypothetical protein